MKLKELEGKTVWLYPTGNNARLYSGQNIEENVRRAAIVKVARVNVSIIYDSFSREQKLRISKHRENHISSDNNSGWLVFDSKKSIDDYISLCGLASILSSKLRYQGNYISLGLDNCKKIEQMLKDLDLW
jgi:hypothetical protein